MNTQDIILNKLKIILNMTILNTLNHELEAHKGAENLIYGLRLNEEFFTNSS